MPYGLPVADNATLEVFGGKLRVKDFSLDVSKLAEAASQTVSAGFVATHNHRSVLLLTADSADCSSDTTTPIQAGIRVGQLLTIILNANPNGKYIRINSSGNTDLLGTWNVGDYGLGLCSWLQVCWNGSKWCEVGRGYQGNSASGSFAFATNQNSVASGVYSSCEGYSSTASGQSAHAEGRDTLASGTNSHAEGKETIASVSESHAEGNGCMASGDDAHAEGCETIASGDYSHAEGRSNTALGSYSHAQNGFNTAAGVYSSVMGKYAFTDRQFQFAHGGDRFEDNGDAQYSRDVLRRQVTHTDATWYVIGNDDTASGLTLPNDGAWTFTSKIVGITAGCGKVYSYLINGCIKRTSSTTALLASNVTALYEDNADFECEAIADDGTDQLRIRVRDNGSVATGDTVRWVAVVELVQVIWAD